MVNNALVFAIIASACTMWQCNNQKTEVTFLPDKHDYHIFFDVGGVLAKGYVPKAIWHIGPWNISNYVIREKTIPSKSALQKRLFEYMDHITGMPTHNSILSCNRPLPGIMYNWITGTQGGDDMVDLLHNHPNKDNFFDSNTERDLVLGSANLFRPQNYGNIVKAIQKGVELLKECLEQYPDQVYILSNWDESCDILKERFPEVFAQIPEDHIIFSWHAGCAKPDQEIFNLAAKTAGLNPNKKEDRAKLILIDDGVENIDTNLLPSKIKKEYLANNNNQHKGIIPWGGQGILHTDVKATRKELIEILKS